MNGSIDNSTFFSAVNNTKIGLAFGFLVLVLLVILAPYFILRAYLSKGLRSPGSSSSLLGFLGVFNCFAAGIFMTTGLLELYPEVLEATESALKIYNVKKDFHFGALIVLLGIFLIMFIEESMHAFKNRINKYSQFKDGEDKLIASIHHQVKPESVAIKPTENNNNTYETFPNAHFSTSSDVAPLTESEINRQEVKEQALSEQSIYIMIGALTFHSLFEGMALGLQKELKTVVLLFFGISIHKSVIAITLGLQMAECFLSVMKSVVCGCFLSLSTPTGILIGIILVSLDKDNSPSLALTSAVLQGIACGTFLYIVFFDILPQEIQSLHNRIRKFFSMFFGFVLVALLIYLLH